MITVCAIETTDPEYKKTLELRDLILRQPLGMSLFDELTDESHEFHIIAKYDDQVVACLILTPLPDQTTKMRQVAVCQSMQGKGIGKQLLDFSENFAKEKGFIKMTASARITAVPFYIKNGYLTSGAEYLSVGIPHILIEKKLG